MKTTQRSQPGPTAGVTPIAANPQPNISRSLPAYLPHEDDKLITWLQQFLNAFGPIYPVIGVTSSTDYVQLTVDFVAIRNAYYSAVYAKGISEALTKFKNLAIYDRNQLPVTAPKQEGNLFPSADLAAGGFIWRVISIINQNLASPKCTEDIKRQLQIFPPEKSKPDLHAQVFVIEGGKLLDETANLWWKKGDNDAATFQYREQGEDDAHWHGAGTFISSPSPLAIPKHNKARVVEVIGRYVKGNHQVGEWSAPYQLTIPVAIG